MVESLRDRIISQYEAFSAGEKKVAKYVTDHYQEILAISSGELAQITGVSDATVVRFAKTLGYKGFLQLRNDMKKELGTVRSLYSASQNAGEILTDNGISRYILSQQADAERFAAGLDMKMIERVSRRILDAETVYLCGIGSDRVVADYLNNYFPLIGIRTELIDEVGLSMKERVMHLCDRDYVVMSSYPSVQQDEFWMARYAREMGAGLFLITDSDITARIIDPSADYVKTGSSIETFYNSAVLSMYFCDILLMKLHEMDPERADVYLKKYDEITGQDG